MFSLIDSILLLINKIFCLFDNKNFLLFVALTNFVVSIFSINYYLPQLLSTNFLLWFFVADCVVYSFLFGVLTLLRFKKINNNLFGFIVIAGCIKYALWTLFVLFLSNGLLNHWLITISHLLLLLQVIIFYKFFELKLKHFFVVVLWFLLNDFFDYVFLTHPFFNTNFFTITAMFSVLISLIIPFFVSIAFSKK